MDKPIKTLVGKEGYLFLINDSNKEMEIHVNGYNNVTDDSFNKYSKYMDKLLMFVYPDKSYHMRKYLPDNIISQYRPGFLMYKNFMKEKLFDCTEILKNLDEPFYKTDTHINFIGGYYVYYYFIEQINKRFNLNIEFKSYEIKVKKEINLHDLQLGLGDLLFSENKGNQEINSINDNYYYIDEVPYFYTKYLINNENNIRFLKLYKEEIEPKQTELKDVTDVLTGKFADWHIISKHTILSKSNDAVNKRVLIFYDSFLLHSIQLYFGIFNEMYFYKGNFNEELIEIINPDYIFEFRVERFLN